MPKKTTLRQQIANLHRGIEIGLQAIDTLDITLPWIDEIKVGFDDDGSYKISLEIHVGCGVTVPFYGFIGEYDADAQIEQAVTRIVERVKLAWQERDRLSALLEDLRSRAPDIFAAARQAGSPVQLLGVSLADTFLRFHDTPFEVAVTYERLSGRDLRPETTSTAGADAAAISEKILDDVSWYKQLAERRAALQEVGAAGYVDSMTLSLIDTQKRPREIVLRELARGGEVFVARKVKGLDIKGIWITMIHGVATWDNSFDSKAKWQGDKLWIRELAEDKRHDLIGKRVSEVFKHRFVKDDIVITGIDDSGPGAILHVAPTLYPFDAAGHLVAVS